ncbi:uncharacterized protein C2845_PM11G05470 [Panicum miliaceum]|uniref:PHD-type domain-containing protein n=1 Tax=Panicum miliaceum TaxID=4540 RepID=A0A3L6RTX0_PANMI|nr:uncharacterized protein C2845_PM11G05470 [Panicum miliaceum]
MAETNNHGQKTVGSFTIRRRGTKQGEDKRFSVARVMETCCGCRGVAARLPGETQTGRRFFYGMKELLLSDHFDTRSAHTFEGKCVVHTLKEYKKLSKARLQEFFCRFEYKVASASITPDQVTVCCTCEVPYNSDLPMIRCSGCKDRFHPSCVHVDIEQTSNLDHFICPNCVPENCSKELSNPCASSPSTKRKVRPLPSLPSTALVRTDVWSRPLPIVAPWQQARQLRCRECGGASHYRLYGLARPQRSMNQQNSSPPATGSLPRNHLVSCSRFASSGAAGTTPAASTASRTLQASITPTTANAPYFTAALIAAHNATSCEETSRSAGGGGAGGKLKLFHGGGKITRGQAEACVFSSEMEGGLPQHALIPGGAPFDLAQQFHIAAQPQMVQAHQGLLPTPAVDQMQELGNVEEAPLGPKEDASGKATATASQWHRVKWTSDMVKLLVSAVSYVDEDIDADHSGARRMGKWRLVSSAMTKRGFAVSPQQCEDKFHDLNKKYKRVTEILGLGTACKFVENPALLEEEGLSWKFKEKAKKLLSSKHLHFEQMCSYHNRNRTCLLDDPVLQKMLQRMARMGPSKNYPFQYDKDNNQVLISDDEGGEFNRDLEVTAEDHVTKKLPQVAAQGSGGPADEKDPSHMDAAQIHRERLEIKRDMLKIKKRRLERMRSIKEQEWELQKMRMDNEMMDLENDQLELELELKEMEMGIKPKRIW